jgi:hypothetical protein
MCERPATVACEGPNLVSREAGTWAVCSSRAARPFTDAATLVCEVFGRFCILGYSLTRTHFRFTYYHGYMTEHVDYQCDKYETLNCTALYEAGNGFNPRMLLFP